jgi:hypothetical protein
MPDNNKDLHEIIWNSAEHNIQDTKADVLVIFDCCNAGEMERNVRGSAFTRRAFEYMAATSHNSTTKKPGPHSFTAALIWALKEMVRCKPGKRFSTPELLLKIFHAPNFPQDQSPRLTERGPTDCLRRIVLRPMDNENALEYGEEDPEGSAQSPKVIRDTLDLRFVFDRPINRKIVRDLARNISNLISQQDVGVSTVVWKGINSTSPEQQQLLDYANHWRSNLSRSVLPDQQLLSLSGMWRKMTKKRSRGSIPDIDHSDDLLESPILTPKYEVSCSAYGASSFSIIIQDKYYQRIKYK